MESSTVISKELDYKKPVSIHPTYRMNRIYAQSGSTTATLNTSGGQEMIYEIPITPFNLSKSYITFRASIPALAANFNILYRDVFSWFRQMQIYTRGGVYLMDLNELANYTKVVWKSDIGLLEFLDLDVDIPGSAATDILAQPLTTGASTMLQRSNELRSSINSAGSGVGTGRPTGGGAYGALAGSQSSISYTECRYLSYNLLVNQVMSINISLPLRLLKNTICAVDKDIYVGEILQLRIVFNPVTKIYFTSTTDAGTNAGGAAAAANITISNMSLYLATEKDSKIVNSLTEKVASGGYSLLIPYVYTYKNSLTGSNVSQSLRFNRGHGKNLQKVYYSVFNSAETINTAYDNSNIILADGTNQVINNYYSLLNNVRLQEYNMQCNNWDDYKLLYDKLRGSITQNSNIYNYNQFWVDDFCNYEKLHEEYDGFDRGLDLNIEQKWDIYLTLNTALAATPLNHYAFAITQKVLTISPSGVTCL